MQIRFLFALHYVRTLWCEKPKRHTPVRPCQVVFSICYFISMMMILHCTVVMPTVHTTIMRLHTIIHHYINRGTQSGFRNVWCLLFCFLFAFVQNIVPLVLVYIGIIHTMYTILHNLHICIIFIYILLLSPPINKKPTILHSTQCCTTTEKKYHCQTQCFGYYTHLQK